MTFFRENPIAGVIVACELGLWVLLAVGLVLRYLARLPLAGAIVLAGIPLLDVVLLVAAALDLHRGAEADATHGLAGIYLGTSVAFGPAIIRWADVRFAHRFAGGPAPVKHPKGSAEHQRALWQEWRRVVVAAAIASVALLLLAYGFAESDARGPLLSWAGRAWVVAGIWLVAGPLWDAGSRRGSPHKDEATT